VSEGPFERWSETFGDPTFAGWLATFGFFLTAWICRRVVFFTPIGKKDLAERRLWVVLGFLFLFLGINKQLDLQILLFEIGKSLAHAEGWYAERRSVEREFVLFVGLLAVGGSLLLYRFVRHASEHAKVAVAGAILLFGFIVVRAALFTKVSRVLGSGFHHLIELAGIAVSATAGMRRIRRLRSAR